jgi:hypothetical protein
MLRNLIIELSVFLNSSAADQLDSARLYRYIEPPRPESTAVTKIVR